MTVRISDITSASWSPKVGSPGEIVTDLDDIEQCIGIILTTRKDSDPHRPLFGCDAWLWIDKPADVAVPNIVMESATSLKMWEPRIKLVSVTAVSELANSIITVEWQPKGEQNLYRSEVIL